MASEPGRKLAAMLDTANLTKIETKATLELSSGLKGNYMNPEVAEHTRQALSAEQHITEDENTQSKTVILENRMKSSIRSCKDIRTIANDFHTRVTSAQSAGTEDRNFADFCKDQLAALENILNRRDAEGRSLFGGAATQRNAVDLSQVNPLAPGALPDATYNGYMQGEPAIHSVTLNDETVTYGFHAEEPAIRDLIFYLKSGSVTSPDNTPGTPNSIRLGIIQDGLHSVSKGLADISDTLGRQLGNIERVSHESEMAAADYKEEQSHIIQADKWKAWAERQEAANTLDLIHTMISQDTRRLKDLFQQI